MDQGHLGPLNLVLLHAHLPLGWLGQVKLGKPGKGQEGQGSLYLGGSPSGLATPE